MWNNEAGKVESAPALYLVEWRGGWLYPAKVHKRIIKFVMVCAVIEYYNIASIEKDIASIITLFVAYPRRINQLAGSSTFVWAGCFIRDY